MNRYSTCAAPGLRAHLASRALYLLLLGLLGRATSGGVPIPDQVVYGTIAIGNVTVTNNATFGNVTVEARRASDGALLTSYRMGSKSGQGPFYYVLRVPMEEGGAAVAGRIGALEPILVTVRKSTSLEFTSTTFPAVSGEARRLDFGVPIDTNGNGVRDTWEEANLGGLAPDLRRDSDGDGATDAEEYAAGTGPNDARDALWLAIRPASAETVSVSFLAQAAQGAGFEGRTRYYSLETSTDLVNWVSVPNFSRIAAANQPVVYQAPFEAESGPAYYRARVWLEP